MADLTDVVLDVPDEHGRLPRLVTRSYPQLGGMQERCLIADPERHPPFHSQEILPFHALKDTVLGALYPTDPRGPHQMYLATPLPGARAWLKLPRIPKHLVSSSEVNEDQGRFLGHMVRVPGLLVHANRIALFQEINRDRAATNDPRGPVRYDWESAVGQMALEAAFLIGRVLADRVLKWKMKPGFHGHAVPRAGLPPDQVVISQAFARRLFADQRNHLQGLVSSWKRLSGFPIYGARFPVFEHGCLPMRLVIEEGTGFFLGVNPFVMDRLFQGDFDGDQLYAAFRLADLADGTVAHHGIPLRRWQNEFGPARAHTGLSDLRLPAGQRGPRLNWYADASGRNKVAEKAAFPPLATAHDRVQAVERADERLWVATFTMVFCWWIPRILMCQRRAAPRVAYERGHRAGEYWNELCFDARKGKSALKGFDIHGFMELMHQGGKPIPASSLRAQGIPAEALTALEEAWRLAGWNLRRECAISPVYEDLILNRRRLRGGGQYEEREHPVTQMLRVFKQMDPPIDPADVLGAICDDLDGLEPLGRPIHPTL